MTAKLRAIDDEIRTLELEISYSKPSITIFKKTAKLARLRQEREALSHPPYPPER